MGNYQEAKKNNGKEDLFVNPYHFVRLASKCKRDTGPAEEETFTGWMDCTLKTLTPVFIPDTENDANDALQQELLASREWSRHDSVRKGEVKSYDFFSYEKTPKPEQPVIPGSEIRGVVRSAFEAVTDSCLSSIDDELVLYKRVTTAASAGRLTKNGDQWQITPCERLGIKLTDHPISNDHSRLCPQINRSYPNGIHEGDEVWIKGSGWPYKTRNGYEAFYFVEGISNSQTSDCKTKGYYHKGEPFGSKHHESVFINVPGAKSFDIPKVAVNALQENYKLFANDKVNQAKGHNGYKHISSKKRDDLNGALIYYTQHGDHYYLCPAAIGREVFLNKIENLISQRGFQPCENTNALCAACRLFGMVEKGAALGSRVRFTDAKLNKKPDSGLYGDVTILPELASPKPSATEFYLKKPTDDAQIWNYDYAAKWEQDSKTRKWNPQPTDIPNAPAPEIRGRKFYWHQQIPAAPKHAEVPTERNVAVRPLNSDAEFSFRVYFDEITEKELQQLLWVLSIGGKTAHAHKMGMGKPVGLGSVAITVDELKQRTVVLQHNTIQYDVDDLRINEALPLMTMKYMTDCKADVQAGTVDGSVDSVRDFLNITDFENPPKNVRYPYNRNEGGKNPCAAFHWFGANKQIGNDATGTRPMIHEPLREIEDPELPVYEPVPRK